MLDEQALKQRLQEIVVDDYKAPSRPELYPLLLAMNQALARYSRFA